MFFLFGCLRCTFYTFLFYGILTLVEIQLCCLYYDCCLCLSFVFYCESLSKKKKKKRNNTNHVDIRSLLDQAGHNVLVEDPSGHMQGRHPTAVHSINISAIAGQNMNGRQSCILC